MSARLTVATDGSCYPNPGPGGWAWVSQDGPSAAGYEAHTTNQRMEIRAILEAVAAHQFQPITIESDSQYAINCLTTWLPKWRAKNWVIRSKPVANQGLIRYAAAIVEAGDVEFRWVKGHDGHALNEVADQLCGTARRECGPCPPFAPLPFPPCELELPLGG